MDDLDRKASSLLAGKVVRKDLLQKVKSGTNVPVYVLEYLLGKYCATDDEAAIEAGLKLVNSTLADNLVRPDEAMKAQARVQQTGHHEFIDKVKVRYNSSEDKYWAELVNFGHKYVHVPQRYVTKYERTLVGGVWAQVQVVHRYDETAAGKKSPFWIDEMKPIQVAELQMELYEADRTRFSTDEWLDLLIRSIGLEPTRFDPRLKLLFLSRLIPMVETNYNMAELGPRGTGKSFVYQELSPYVILLTGPTTVANMFYNMSTNRVGLVGLWDCVAFDEVADLEKMPREVVTTLKTYCESGKFARGKESLSGHASISMFGNTNQPVDVMVRASHLFDPMPRVIRDDMAFLDRIHYYLPGWEIPKMRNEYISQGYGFVSDYLAEAMKELRRRNMTEALDKSFSLGRDLNTRDAKAVRKTLSGFLKLMHPDGGYTKAELREYLEMAIEGRRRVKEQLKKLGSFEFHQTSFSYVDRETMEEHFVGVPEQGGKDLISQDPLAAGSVYAVGVGDDGRPGLYRIEVGTSAGTGKLGKAGSMPSVMKESLDRAFSFMKGHRAELGLASEFDTTDYHVQAVDLVGNQVAIDAGVGFLVALFSAVKKAPVLGALVVAGDMTIQGNLRAAKSLADLMRTGMDNGAKRALVPVENKRDYLEVPADVAEKVDPVFFGDLVLAARKALGVS